MALTIPNVAPSGCTPGERLIFNILKKNLQESYFVWYEPTLFGKKISVRPDFLLLEKHVGLIIIEVKDWTIPKIREANRDMFVIENGISTQTRTNPEKQVKLHLNSALDMINKQATLAPEKYNLLIEKSGPYKGKVAIPYTYFIAFPNIKSTDWQKTDLSNIINENHTLLRDNLDNNDLEEKFLKMMPFQANLSVEQIDVVKWILYPEITIKPEQVNFLDTEQASLILTDTFIHPEYEGISTNLNIKLVRGTVGSGKTLILLKRAKYISEKLPDNKILILTYNKSLKSYLDKVFNEIGGSISNVEILHFHKWCYNLLSEKGIFKKPLSNDDRLGLLKNMLADTRDTEFSPEFLLDEFDWIKERIPHLEWSDYLYPDKVKRIGRKRGLGINEKEKRRKIYDLFEHYQLDLSKMNVCDWADIPVNLIQAIEKGQILSGRYDAILIDEAQDFAPSWFLAIMKMIKPKTGSMFIVGDGAQRIYRRDFTWKEVGIAASAQNTTILSKSYRNTHEILDVAIELIKESQTLVKDLSESGDSIAEHENNKALRHGPLPILMTFNNRQIEYSAVASEIKNLLNQGCQPQQIAILHRHKERNDDAVNELRKHKIPYTVMIGITNLLEPTIKICTLHSAKGLEFDTVFICGLDDLSAAKFNEDNDEIDEKLDLERKLLYVGMTRARQRLYVTYSGVEPSWIVNRIKEKFELKN